MQRLIILALFACALFANSAAALEPGWWGVVIAPESMRDQIQSTPIIERSYRPFHIYGNTVRRRYYRGTALPVPRDFVKGSLALVVRR